MNSVATKLTSDQDYEPLPEEESLDKYPEISTTEQWRGLMKRTREARGLTQAQLGAKVGVSQNVISKMESGDLRASKAVIPICNILRIPPPMALFEDELDQRWYDAGRRLRALDEKTFRMLLVGAEASMQEAIDQADRERNQ